MPNSAFRSATFCAGLALALTSFVACLPNDTDDENADGPQDAIQVLVLWADGRPAAGATATLRSTGAEALADEFGRVGFAGTAGQTITVDVTSEGRVGRREIYVLSSPEPVSIYLAGDPPPRPPDPEGSPELVLESPEAGLALFSDGEVKLVVRVIDDSPPAGVAIEWSTPEGKLLRSGFAGSNGLDELTTEFSRGARVVVVRATDASGQSTTRRFALEIGSQPEMAISVKDVEGGRRVSWSRYLGPTAAFDGYHIERNLEPWGDAHTAAEWRPVASVNDIAAYSFLDTFPDPLTAGGFYRVRAPSLAGQYSGIVAFDSAPLAMPLDFSPRQLLAHPVDPCLVYLLGWERGAFDRRYRGRVDLYNLAQARTVASASIPAEIGYASIADLGKGLELFVPSDTGRVFVFAAADLSEREGFAQVNKMGRAAIAFEGARPGEGFVVLSTQIQYSTESNIHTHDRGGRPIDRQFLPILSYPDLRRLPGRLAVMAFETGSSGARAAYIELAPGGRFGEVSLQDFRDRFAFDGRTTAISPDGRRIVTGARVVGSPDAGFALDFDIGPPVARGTDRVDLPGYPLHRLAFAADGARVYAAGGEEPRYNESIRPSYVRLSFPGLALEGNSLSRGYITEMTRLADGRLLSVQVKEYPYSGFYFGGPRAGLIFLE